MTDPDPLVDVLAGAATAMPWPAEQIDERLVAYASRVVDDPVSIESLPAQPPEVSVLFGDARYLVVHGDAADDQQRRILAALASMATASRHAAVRDERLRRRAATDDLTGLWTQAAFGERLEAANDARSTAPFGVLFVDLDRFKAVNERLGHVDADAVLREVGVRLGSWPRAAHAARMGGDEFAALVPGVSDHAHLGVLAGELRDRLREPIPVRDELLHIDATIGTALSSAAAADPDHLIREAERAMRHAKRSGPPITPPRWYDEGAMLRALLDEHRIEVAYQPIVDLTTGLVHGYEGLVRANHLDFGPVSPLLVVSAASRLRLLDELTEAVLASAISTVAAAARIAGTPLVLSINVEFEQLRQDSRLLQSLPTRLRGTDVRLVLEVSERSVVRWSSSGELAAQALADAGIGLAVDDFGAGYATFAMLEAWPWTWVKIDRGLVAGPEGERSRRLLGHVAHLLGDLDQVAVAEGVESLDQLAHVRDLGVCLAQGRLLGEPLPGAEMLAQVEAHGLVSPTTRT